MTLFDGSGPRLRTIAASAPFLDTLVGALVDALPAEDPFALADCIVFLPNRRASRGLIEAFARRLGGAALLPSIRPLGDIDDDPDIWGPDPLALDVPPAIAPTRRRFEIARLVRARDTAEGGTADPVRALALADELCRLLDSAATLGGVDWTKLDAIVAERNLAAHWTKSAAFLSIVTQYWPQRLSSEGLVDAAARKTTMIERLAAAWRTDPPQKPVLIAGSTGSALATRVLMHVVASLPKGVVVLPGLDLDTDDEIWTQIEAQHPQASLRRTLESFRVTRAAVTPIEVATDERAQARSALLREALAPAGATADWRVRLDHLGGPALIELAVQGLSLVEAETEDEEATAIALLLRETLEQPDRTAALVTPDGDLARRVEAKLERWGVAATASAGRALSETPHGVLVRLLAELVEDDGAPIALLALAKHPLVGLGMPANEKRDAIAALERNVFAGPRRWRDFAALAQLASHAERNTPQGLFATPTLLAPLGAALAPLKRAEGGDLSQLAEAIAEAAEAAARGVDGEQRLWSGPDGEAVAEALREMAEFGADLGAIEAHHAPRLLALLLSSREAPPRQGDPRIAIWGPLEARLQRRDRMILGGLNEGVWPPQMHQDGFLSRGMRAGLGLPEPEERIGLSAHDFAQLASAPEVIMTRAKRRGASPSVASRWIWRLATLARAANREDALTPSPDRDPRAWARVLDAPRAPERIGAPKPRPPAEARLRRISFTAVETLIRDPYAIYARRILKLEALKRPDADPGPAERGTAIHDAIEAFGDGDDSRVLLRLLEEKLLATGFSVERVRAERARLERASTAFCAWSAARREAGYRSFREVSAELQLRNGVVLQGRADRIDIRPDGRAELIDYKSGLPPSDEMVRTGLSAQLTLEAAALAAGAFAGPPRAQADALVYWRFGGKTPEACALDLEKPTMDAAREAHSALEEMLDKYARPQQPFLSKPRAQFVKPYADYDHLARRAEWADVEGEDE